MDLHHKHLKDIINGASTAFILKLLAAGISFGLTILLARLLGAAGSGLFFLALTIVTLSATVSRFGMDNLLIRSISRYMVSGQTAKAKGIYSMSMRYGLAFSVILATILYTGANWLSSSIFNKPQLAETLHILAPAIPLIALLSLQASALRGLKKIATSIIASSILTPLTTGVLIIFLTHQYSTEQISYYYLLGAICALLFGILAWRKNTKPYPECPDMPDARVLLQDSLPLFIIVAMNLGINQLPVILLGIWENSENIGIYSVASRTAMLTSFILSAVNSISAPKFAEIHHLQNRQALNTVARYTSTLMLLTSTPILLIFIIFPDTILGFFGASFKQGTPILIILTVGQFVNVTAGTVGNLLIMSGYDKLVRNTLIVGAVSSFLLNLLLLPNYGILGAAIVSASMLATMNIIMMYLVWKKLGIVTLPLFRKP